MSRKNIFENVEIIGSEYPINESIGGVIGIIGGIIGITILGCHIMDKYNKQKIINSIKNLEKSDNDIRKFKNNIKAIKPIKDTDLIKLVSKSDKDINNIKYVKCACYIIEGINDNLIAYAVYDETINKYGYRIIDNKFKNNEKISNYIKALFELKFGVISDGIKYFNKNMPKMAYLNRSNDYISSNELEISKEEYKNIIDGLKNTGEKLKNSFKNNRNYIVNEDVSDTEYTISIQDANYPDQSKYDDYEDWLDDEENYWHDNFKKVITDINNKIKNILESLGFDVKIQDFDLTATNSNKYPWLNVKTSQNNDDELYVEIIVRLNKIIKVI